MDDDMEEFRFWDGAVEFEPSWNLNLPSYTEALLEEVGPRAIVAGWVYIVSQDHHRGRLWLIDRSSRITISAPPKVSREEKNRKNISLKSSTKQRKHKSAQKVRQTFYDFENEYVSLDLDDFDSSTISNLESSAVCFVAMLQVLQTQMEEEEEEEAHDMNLIVPFGDKVTDYLGVLVPRKNVTYQV